MVNMTSIIPSWNLSILIIHEVPRRTDVLITCVKIIFRVRRGLLFRLWKRQSPRSVLLRTYSPWWSDSTGCVSFLGLNPFGSKIDVEWVDKGEISTDCKADVSSVNPSSDCSDLRRHCHHQFVIVIKFLWISSQQGSHVLFVILTGLQDLGSVLLKRFKWGSSFLYAEQVNVLVLLERLENQFQAQLNGTRVNSTN